MPARLTSSYMAELGLKHLFFLRKQAEFLSSSTVTRTTRTTEASQLFSFQIGWEHDSSVKARSIFTSNINASPDNHKVSKYYYRKGMEQHWNAQVNRLRITVQLEVFPLEVRIIVGVSVCFLISTS